MHASQVALNEQWSAAVVMPVSLSCFIQATFISGDPAGQFRRA